MTTREYFERVREAERELWRIQRQREHWEEMATRLSGMGETAIRSTDIRSPTETAGIHLADLSRDLDEDERRYTEIVREARALIAKIQQSKFREVLTLRYICCHGWKRISEEMQYTGEKSVYVVHGWALKAAEQYLPENSTK